MKMKENKEWICTNCGEREYFVAMQSGHGCLRFSIFSKAVPIKHEVCATCGTIVRSYIENPREFISQ